MAGRLFGSAASGNSAPPAIAGFKVQTAVYGLPIPIVYGQARIAGNLIHMYPSSATPQLSQGSRNKFVKIDQQVTGYLYQAPIVLALCEGPIVGIAKVWRDKDAGVAFSTYSSAGWSLFLGTLTQSPWTYLSSNHPGDAFPYQLTAYVAHPLLELPNDVLSNYTWEIQGLAQYGSGIIDANPADVVADVLTNAHHGLDFPSAQLDGLTDYAAYCAAAGLFLSPVLDGQSPLANQLATLVETTNSQFVWSNGLLKIVPYADQPVTGDGSTSFGTYTPNVTPIYDLTDDDFIAPAGTDPVVITRKKPADCYNQLMVEFEDRAHDYNPNTQEAKDQTSIDAFKLRPAPSLRYTAIKSATTARYVAQLKLQRELSIRNSYAFTLSARYALLEPMDLVTLTDAVLGLHQTPVRITEIIEAQNGDLQMIAEDFPLGVASASRYGAPGANGPTNANNTPPGATVSPVIFEGPGPLVSSALEIWMAASGGANWGGCDVHLSTDNVTYTKVGSITRKGSFGVLTAALATAAVSPPNDTTHTLAVDLSVSGGHLTAGSASDLAALVTLCLVDGEFLAFQGASLTSAFNYALTTLARGLFGSTIPASHAIGASFVRCDQALLKLPFPQGTNGQVVYFKFPAFNIFGLGLEDVSTVTAYAHTIGRNTVTVGGAGYVNPPTSSLTQSLPGATTEQVLYSAQRGIGAIGPLTWTYQIGSNTPVTGSGGFPFTITVPRAMYYDTPLVATVTQSDGQTDTQNYLVSARFPGIDPTTGKVDRAAPFNDGKYAPTADGSNNLINASGDPLIDLNGKTMLSGLAIGTGVRGAADVAFGSTVKYAPNRHTEQKTGVDGDTLAYGVSFDNAPKVAVTPLKYLAATAGNVAEFSATGGVGSCMLRCVQTSGATSTGRTDSFASTLNGTPAGGIILRAPGAAAFCNLTNADGTAITYQVNYDIDTTSLDPANTCYVQVYTNRGVADNTNWDLVASASYGSGVSATGEYLSFTSPSSGTGQMNANYDIRVVVTYATTPSVPTRAAVTCNTVTYTTVSGGTTTSLTGFAGAKVQVQAVEAA